MFEGQEILELVKLFDKRHVKLYHSVQYLDFISYLRLGGIPSRSLMDDQNLPMTALASDKNDRINKMWDKVFLNPLDFGKIYNSGNGVPTVYGPITLVFKPQALFSAKSVAICLRSAGSFGFNREKESLKSVEEVNRIFAYKFSDDPKFKNKNSSIKFSKELKEEFKMNYVSYPEISLDIEGGLLKFSCQLTEIIVDPYLFNGIALIYKVSQKTQQYKLKSNLKKRLLNDIPGKILPEILTLLLKGLPTVDELMGLEDVSSDFKKWVCRLDELKLGQQWLCYAQYLRSGTLIPFLKELGIHHIQS